MSTDVESLVDLDSLEDIFNEPHCENKHSGASAPPCTHKVVCQIGNPCGCVSNGCAAIMKYAYILKRGYLGRYYDCVKCGAAFLPVRSIRVLPKG